MKIIIFILISVVSVKAQVTVPFNSEKWKFATKDYVLEDYLGRPSVLLKKNRATLSDANFENGIIEYDLAFPHGRAFIGVMFRVQEDDNFEEFYVRSHQSGNPDANQYTPVYNSVAAWQLYYGEGFGTPVIYSFNDWIHVKLAVSGKYMDVYINDMENPVLFCELRRAVQKGNLGVENSSEGHFANFTYTVMDQVQLKGTPKEKPPLATGTISKWQIANPLPEKTVENITLLNSAVKKDLSWNEAQTELTGTLNIASVIKWSKENNTTFAKVIVESDKAQVKKLFFGFSDRVKLFLNDNLLYSGEDNFASRDYRFLGTIGYYDAVYLNLKKGRNEIMIAVSEDFGGWGIKARFDEPAGLKF